MSKLFFLVILILLSSCGKSAKTKLADELIPVLGAAMMEKVEEAELSFSGFSKDRDDRIIKEEGLELITTAHTIALNFYAFADSFKTAHYYEDHYPHSSLIQRFNASFDSISALVPELNLKPFDNSHSEHKENLILTYVRLKYDMASLEVEVMNKLAEHYWVTIYRDEFK